MVCYIIFLKVSSSAEAIDFLLELEKSDRNSIKHVVLDCTPRMAKVRKTSLVIYQQIYSKFYQKHQNYSRKNIQIYSIFMKGNCVVSRSKRIPWSEKFSLPDVGSCPG